MMRNPDGTLDWRERVKIIQSYARRSGYRIFVETGTGEGATLSLLLDDFNLLYSIELGDELYRSCVQRFRHSPKVILFHGDSGEMLPHVLARLDAPAVFWIDSHYCGNVRGKVDTPVREELVAVLRFATRPLILIDDARLFGTDPAYPTVDWIRETVLLESRDGHAFALEEDVMRIIPQGLL